MVTCTLISQVTLRHCLEVKTCKTLLLMGLLEHSFLFLFILETPFMLIPDFEAKCQRHIVSKIEA